MLTRFDDNYELLTEAQNIQIVLQKLQSPILTQVKNLFQASYDLDQDKAVTFDFIYNSIEDE